MTSSTSASGKGRRWVYFFGDGDAEGDASMRDRLGGKGAGLAEMSRLGMPVPPGFTISSEVCACEGAAQGDFPDGLDEQMAAALDRMASIVGKRFGDPSSPLLLSVRSGARDSMPGMLDTVLNIGADDRTVEGLTSFHGDARFARDSYRRLIQMYGGVVCGVDADIFETLLEERRAAAGVAGDADLDADDLAALIEDFKGAVAEAGAAFPQDAREQLRCAIAAVFRSWNNPRARAYRKLNGIAETLGTAVTVQAMAFGNAGGRSATGVLFTRNPSDGEKGLYGEYLPNAQGEDVVAGIRTPYPLSGSSGAEAPSLEASMPDIYDRLCELCSRLERHYADMQDVEFTVERGRLWLLQTRSGKRSARAAIRIAVDMVKEGTIDRDQAILRLEPAMLDRLLHPVLDPKAPRRIVATGLPASPGAAQGRIVFSPAEAERLAGEGEPTILVREETSPEDIHGMAAAAGILTVRGGMTSHAAVVARGMGRPCVCGASALRIDLKTETLIAGEMTLKRGDILTVDGSDGSVMAGRVKMRKPEWSPEFELFMQWVDGARRLRVRANAETPQDAETARHFGAEGIGLCRTEHMFFAPERIDAMRRAIIADDEETRRRMLDRLEPMQRDDFAALFRIMADLPVTVRLLDPPLHEFLPHDEGETLRRLAEEMAVSEDDLRRRVAALREVNPMLGHRGCRLGIVYPEIYEMQMRALFEARAAAVGEGMSLPALEVMIPLVCDAAETAFFVDRARRLAEAAGLSPDQGVDYVLGAMIELPRAALCADEIARDARFFSFGTNDLTQTTFGLSRDDSSRFLERYVDGGIFPADPFVKLDPSGVGALIRIAVEKGRSARGDIKLGICGEHGGDPSSIAFCEGLDLDYVSCSPYRVPAARLAAAQAAVRRRAGESGG